MVSQKKNQSIISVYHLFRLAGDRLKFTADALVFDHNTDVTGERLVGSRPELVEINGSAGAGGAVAIGDGEGDEACDEIHVHEHRAVDV